MKRASFAGGTIVAAFGALFCALASACGGSAPEGTTPASGDKASAASTTAGCTESDEVAAFRLADGNLCVEAQNDDQKSGIQRFRFDAKGQLVEHEQLVDDAKTRLAIDRWEWGTDKIRKSPRDDVKDDKKIETFTLGAHGELTHVEADGGESVADLRWEGTFGPAPAGTRWFLEALYLATLPHPLLPRHTAERTIFQRMRPFLFTGTVTVAERTKRGSRDVTARYDGGRLVEMSDGSKKLRLQWTKESDLTREEQTVEGGVAYTLTMTSACHHPKQVTVVGGAMTREVTFGRNAKGLAQVTTELRTATDTLKANVTVRPCGS